MLNMPGRNGLKWLVQIGFRLMPAGNTTRKDFYAECILRGLFRERAVASFAGESSQYFSWTYLHITGLKAPKID